MRDQGRPDVNVDLYVGNMYAKFGNWIIGNLPAVTVRGRVLNPEGKPFEGARLYLWTTAFKTKSDSPVRATTGQDGGFRFMATQNDIERAGVLMAFAKDSGSSIGTLGNSNRSGPTWQPPTRSKRTRQPPPW